LLRPKLLLALLLNSLGFDQGGGQTAMLGFQRPQHRLRSKGFGVVAGQNGVQGQSG